MGNKTCFITGVSGGIGLAVAQKFASEGYDLYLHCLKFGETESGIKDDLEKKNGVYVEYFESDLSDLSQVDSMVQKMADKKLMIDVCVNNAGLYRDKEFFEVTEKDWDMVMAVNLKAVFFLTQKLVKQLMNGKDGAIINISSVAGLYPRESALEYAISKAGLIHLSKSLALVLAPNIRVNVVAPSYTETSLLPFMNDEGESERRKDLIPLKRFNKPDDIAESVYFLASEKARNITGIVVPVDGGRGPTRS